MKILVCGHFLEGSTGWAKAAIEYCLALDAAGYDIVCRSVNLTNTQAELPQKIQAFLSKSIQNVDICIQCLLPHHLGHSTKFKKNLALIFTETDSIRFSPWVQKLNMMDGVIVACSASEQCLKDSGVIVPIYVVPVPCDIAKFSQKREKLKLPICDDFTFLFLGDFTRKKNLSALLKAFHTEFDRSEPVSLVIKTSKFGLNPQECGDQVQKYCEEIKRGLKLYSHSNLYKQEVIITEHMTDEQINQLHYTCDCLVNPSRAEGWSIPTFDSMGFGKWPIGTEGTAMDDFVLDGGNGFLVKSTSQPCFGELNSFGFLYSGRENWREINIGDLREVMRRVYTNKKAWVMKFHEDNLLKHLEKFSYTNVGQQLKAVLES